MKILIFTTSIFLLFTSMLFSQNDDALKTYIENLPIEELSQAETEGLDLMREEEKLARDVYNALYEVWNSNIFTNIAKSEQSHIDLVGLIIEKYGLNDPMTEEPGVFTDSHLQDLYDGLVATGSESIAKAMFVGCTIEDLDIFDLLELMKTTDNEDIRTVYQNLMLGSRNHMRAFDRQYSSQGGTYTAQFITPDELAAILDGNSEHGPVDADGNPLVISSLDVSYVDSDNIKCFPNPFSISTTLEYYVDQPVQVSINIYDNLGNKILTQSNGLLNSGTHSYIFEAESLPQGMYYYAIQIGDKIESGELLLVR